MPSLSDHITFNNPRLARRYARRPIPMTTLYEAYFDGDIDIPGDIYEFLADREHLVKYRLTLEHVRWALSNFLPEVLIHSKAQDKRIVREHYDRGNDFFEFFLDPTHMVYTSAYFNDPEREDLEQAQVNKFNLAARKLLLKPGETLLDIGCGWGGFIRHAAKHHGVDATGVTIAEEQTKYANDRIAKAGVEDRARVLCIDYRDIPKRRFDKIASFEMVEHVGVKNLVDFYKRVYDLLADDGVFLLQWTGLRNFYSPLTGAGSLDPESLIWGLFMNKYIFPGADASLCLSPMLHAMEKAGFEIQSVENVSIHYAWTIERWHQNWMRNRDAVLATYGERWYRIWHFFLAWSSRIAHQGNAACFQITLNKNRDSYNRARWVDHRAALIGAQSQQGYEAVVDQAQLAAATAKTASKRNGKHDAPARA